MILTGSEMTEEKKEAIMDLFYNSHDNRTHVIAEQVGVSIYAASNLITKELNKNLKRTKSKEYDNDLDKFNLKPRKNERDKNQSIAETDR
jgi:ribosome-associated translation inhibitor RaiA